MGNKALNEKCKQLTQKNKGNDKTYKMLENKYAKIKYIALLLLFVCLPMLIGVSYQNYGEHMKGNNDRIKIINLQNDLEKIKELYGNLQSEFTQKNAEYISLSDKYETATNKLTS